MLKLLLGDPNARKLKRYQPLVSDINLLEEEIAPLSDDELRGLNEDKSEVYKEAKGNGFDTKILRKVVSLRKKEVAEA